MKKRKSGITLDVGKPVLYYPGLKKFFADNGAQNGIARDAATLYSNLNYWQDRGERKDGFIYKYVAQLESETGLSKKQQWKCRKFLVDISWLEEKMIIVKDQDVVGFKTLYNLTTQAEKTIFAKLENSKD